jgi:hypothetical protein
MDLKEKKATLQGLIPFAPGFRRVRAGTWKSHLKMLKSTRAKSNLFEPFMFDIDILQL